MELKKLQNNTEPNCVTTFS